MSGELTGAALQGTPIGTPDGMVICDSCNTQITSVRQLRDNEENDTTAHIYATGDARGWALRWTTCEECGPIGGGEVDEPGEAHTTATFTTHPLREIVVIDVVTITACSPPEAVSGE